MAEGSLDSVHEEDVNGCLLPKQGREGKSKPWIISYDCPGVHPRTSQVNAPALFSSHYSSTLEQGLSWLRLNLVVRCCSRSNPKQHLSREGPTIIGDCTSGASEAVKSSGGQTTIPCTPTFAEYPHPCLLLQHRSPLGWGYWFWEGEEQTLKGNWAGLDLTLRVSAPAAWDMPTIGQR